MRDRAAISGWAWAAWALAFPAPAMAALAVAESTSVLKPLGDPTGVLFFAAVGFTAASLGAAIAALVNTRGGLRRGRLLAIAAIPAALAGGAATLLAAVLSGMPHLG